MGSAQEASRRGFGAHFTPAPELSEQVSPCHRPGDVSHHSNHPGALLHRGHLRGQQEAVADRVHTRLRTVLRQVLHHWCDGAGGRCARGSPSGCHHLAGIFREGKRGEQCWVSEAVPAGVLSGSQY